MIRESVISDYFESAPAWVHSLIFSGRRRQGNVERESFVHNIEGKKPNEVNQRQTIKEDRRKSCSIVRLTLIRYNLLRVVVSKHRRQEPIRLWAGG